MESQVFERSSKGMEPAPFIAHPRREGDIAAWKRARSLGQEVLRQGKVAAITVAGGMASRMGQEMVKGMLAVTPVAGKSLFQVFAEKILGAKRRYGVDIPWFIMTSPNNHAATVSFLREHDCLDWS